MLRDWTFVLLRFKIEKLNRPDQTIETMSYSYLTLLSQEWSLLEVVMGM
jgi:hypothetical protein